MALLSFFSLSLSPARSLEKGFRIHFIPGALKAPAGERGVRAELPYDGDYFVASMREWRVSFERARRLSRRNR